MCTKTVELLGQNMAIFCSLCSGDGQASNTIATFFVLFSLPFCRSAMLARDHDRDQRFKDIDQHGPSRISVEANFFEFERNLCFFPLLPQNKYIYLDALASRRKYPTLRAGENSYGIETEARLPYLILVCSLMIHFARAVNKSKTCFIYQSPALVGWGMHDK